MNPGICYLYEYKNNQKLRNVGFMKAAPHYNSCVLQINARGIPVQAKDTIKLFAFYEKDSEIIARFIQELPCGDKNIYSRISVTGSDFPDGKTLEELGGFLLQTAAGQNYAALFENIPFHTEKIKIWKEEPETVIEAEFISDTALESEMTYMPEIQPVFEQAPILNPVSNPVSAPTQEYESTPEPKSIAETDPLEECSTGSDNTLGRLQNEKQEPEEKVRKIQRKDLSILPRRCWNLANNSFLMHGYHNYNHLLLVEDDGHFWLGVPGLYANREARAAELFGFPQFTQIYTSQLELTEDERDTSEKFGYWCRFIR